MTPSRWALALVLVLCACAAVCDALIEPIARPAQPAVDLVQGQVLASAPVQLPPASLTVPMYLSADSLHYFVRVSVGTPAQPLNLLFDTGSGDLMLLSNASCGASSTRTTPSACYASTVSSTWVPTTALHSLMLQIDGENVRSTSPGPVGFDTIRLSATDVGTLTTSTLTRAGAQLVVLPGVTFDGGSDGLQRWPDTDGVLGVSYNLYSFGYRQEFVNLWRDQIDPSMLPVFSLDVNGADAASTLLLNGVNESYRDALQWSDVMGNSNTNAAPGYHSFTLHAMTLCGADLFTTWGAGWTVIVDTGASCLNAPAEFFDMIVSWIPVTCQDATLPAPIGGGQRVCYLSGQFVAQLPTLNFKISADGGWLRLPLEDLLLPPGAGGQRRLCMTRGVSVTNVNFLPVWSFGTRTLRSLYAAFSMPTTQVGLANKFGRYAAPSNGSTLQCTTRTACVGMQTHEPSLNVCVDPPCNLYYFFVFDADAKTCYLDPGFFHAVVVVVVIFLFVEVFLHEATAYLSNKVYTQFAPPQRNAPAGLQR